MFCLPIGNYDVQSGGRKLFLIPFLCLILYYKLKYTGLKTEEKNPTGSFYCFRPSLAVHRK